MIGFKNIAASPSPACAQVRVQVRAQRRARRFAAALVFALAGAASPASAQDGPASAQDGRAPSRQGVVTVEFFTSQACSSCIPAAAYFRELAAREDIVALSWHVDYWNALQTRAGHWVDPYSSKVYTARQRKYNINLRNRSSVFTPQMVINGGAEAIGSEKATVNRLIAEAAADMPAVAVSARREADGAIRFDVSGSAEGGKAYLVVFKHDITTEIHGGENSGRV